MSQPVKNHQNNGPNTLDKVGEKISLTPVPPSLTPARQLGSRPPSASAVHAGSSSSHSKVIGNLSQIPQAGSSGSPSGGLAFTPSGVAGRKRLNFKAKVVARADALDTSASQTDPRTSDLTSARGHRASRGRGRGSQTVEVTASGPFALGPGESSGSRRPAPIRFNLPTSQRPFSGFGEVNQMPRTHLGGVGLGFKEEDREAYSDPDEPHLEIVDVSDVKGLDWMAPDTLKKVVEIKRRKNKQKSVDQIVKMESRDTGGTGLDAPPPLTGKNLTNALDLSESEDDEQLENVIDDFIAMPKQPMGSQADISQENRLYFFQFPKPFPTFSRPESLDKENDASTPSTFSGPLDEKSASNTSRPNTDASIPPLKRSKSVSFAPETKPEMPALETSADIGENQLDGIIGRLEFYRSGAVKMRLGDTILFDVSAATQPSFLQHAVFVDSAATEKKSMAVLGEVSRRFVVSPDVDYLLEVIDRADIVDREKILEGAQQMDVD